MSAWWNSLQLIEQVFLLFAIPSTIVLVLQTLMLLIGLGSSGGADSDLDSDTSGIGDVSGYDGAGAGDVHMDMGGDFDASHDHAGTHGGEHDSGFRMFTVRGFITFFTLFGWTGLVCIQAGTPYAVSVVVALLAGAAGMAITAWAMMSVMKLQSDGSINLVNAIGKTATVYIRVPGGRTDRGKVNLVIQEKLIEASAVTDEENDLTVGSEVVVIGMSSNDTLLVAVKNPRGAVSAKK